MGNDRNGTAALDQYLDSTLEMVDAAEAQIVHLAQKAGFDEDQLHEIGIAARECLVNAVVHGNRYNLKKKVHLHVVHHDGKFVVTIADEGDGFSLEEIPDPCAEQNLARNSGRGILLIRAFMDDLQVRTLSPCGTEVTLVKNTTPA